MQHGLMSVRARFLAESSSPSPSPSPSASASLSPSSSVSASASRSASPSSSVSRSPSPSPGGGASHPRLMMTVAGASPTVAELKTRYASGGAQYGDFQAFVNVYCRTVANGGVFDAFPTNWGAGCYIYGFILATYQVPTITYGVTDTQMATALVGFIDAAIANAENAGETHRLTALAVAYDWGFNYLTNEKKQEIVNVMQTLADEYDVSAYSPLGHVSGRAAMLYAFLGEVWRDDSDAINPGDLTDADNRIGLQVSHVTHAQTGTQAWLNYCSGVTGSYPEGYQYFHSEDKQGHAHMDFLFWEAKRTIYDDSSVWATGANKVHEYAPLYMAHMFAPYKLNWSQPGVAFVFLKGPSSTTRTSGVGPAGSPDSSQQTLALLPNYARVFASSNANMAALAKWLFVNAFYDPGIAIDTGATSAKWTTLSRFIGYNTVTPQSPSALGLPLSIHMPAGTVVMRNAWTFGFTGGTASRVEFVAEPFKWTCKGFGQAPQGSYALDRNGPIVVQPGGGAHGANELGWCGNTVTFHKPGDTNPGGLTVEYWNTGGARMGKTFPNSPLSLGDLVPGSKFDLGGVSRVDLFLGAATQYFGATYANVTNAYNGPTTHAFDTANLSVCENYEREFVWFPPDTPGVDPDFVVVFSRTRSTGLDVEQRSQFYPANNDDGSSAFTISGHSSKPDDCLRDGVTTQRWLGSGGSVVGTLSYTAQRSLSAKAFWSPILPASLQVIERGSASRRWERPNGVPFDTQSHDQGGPMFEGNRHFELLPQTTAQIMNFLEVWELTETSASVRTPLAAPSNLLNVVGVRIERATGNKKAVLFKDSPGTLTSGRARFVAQGTYDLLITGWTASGAIAFTKGLNIGTITNVYTGSTSVYAANANGRVWVRFTVSASEDTANNDLSFS